MTMRATTAVLAASACLALAGCGGGQGASASATSTVPSSATTSSAPTTTAATTTTTPPPTTAAMPGPSTTVQTSFGSLTYFGQQRPAATTAPAPQQANTEWVAIDVQLCITPTTPGDTVSSDHWGVTDAGNGQYQPSGLTYEQFPAPEYPFQGYIDPGSCVRGWIVYAVVKGQPLRTVRYFPGNSTAPAATWSA